MNDLQNLDNNNSLSRIELDVQINSAKAYPRDAEKSLKKAIMMATMNDDIASSCLFSLPRKGNDGKPQNIEGGSIRLAEIVMSSWGNIHSGTRIVHTDGRTVTAEAVVWDLEENVKHTCQIKRNIYGTHKDAATLAGNAASAIALRNAAFKVIPKAISDVVKDEAKKVAVHGKKDSAGTPEEKFAMKQQVVIHKLEKLGAKKEDILQFFSKEKIEDLNEDDIAVLIGYGSAISEGTHTVNDIFGSNKLEAPTGSTSALDNALN